MRRVAPFFDRDPAREGSPVTHPAAQSTSDRDAVRAAPAAIPAAENAHRVAVPAAAGAAETGRAASLGAAAEGARRSADAHTTHYVRDSAIPDDARTVHVDERVQATQRATPERSAAGDDANRAAALNGAAAGVAARARTAADVAATSYPRSVNSVPASQAKAAVAGAQLGPQRQAAATRPATTR